MQKTTKTKTKEYATIDFISNSFNIYTRKTLKLTRRRICYRSGKHGRPFIWWMFSWFLEKIITLQLVVDHSDDIYRFRSLLCTCWKRGRMLFVKSSKQLISWFLFGENGSLITKNRRPHDLPYYCFWSFLGENKNNNVWNMVVDVIFWKWCFVFGHAPRS